MESHKVLSLVLCCFFFYINDLPSVSKVLSFYVFGVDTNIFVVHVT